MSLIDSILSLAGLLLWLNWLAPRFDPLARAPAASLAGTLKKTGSTGPRRWLLLAALAALLLGRAGLYWLIGPAAGWTPHLPLGGLRVELWFRSDFPGRMLLFSALSFARVVAVFYLWLLLLSMVNRAEAEAGPVQKLVRLHLGWVDRWPWPLKLLLPLLLGSLAWLALHPLLVRMSLTPQAGGLARLIVEGAVIGLSACLLWKYLIAAVLALHLLHSYVYVGEHPFWLFINTTARHLLVPLRKLPLRAGRMDFAPVVEIVLVFLAAHFAAPALTQLFARPPVP